MNYIQTQATSVAGKQTLDRKTFSVRNLTIVNFLMIIFLGRRNVESFLFDKKSIKDYSKIITSKYEYSFVTQKKARKRRILFFDNLKSFKNMNLIFHKQKSKKH